MAGNRRRTRNSEATLLWSPPPPGWELRGRAAIDARRRPLVLPKEVMVHTAVLYTSDHQPFSEVIERIRESSSRSACGSASRVSRPSRAPE